MLTLAPFAAGNQVTVEINDANLSASSTVPEPSTMALAAIGAILCGVGLRRRKR